MLTALQNLEELPRQNASHVKNKWGDVVRQVHQSGSVAVTSHSTVEMVLMDAAIYRKLVQEISTFNMREQAALDALAGRFNARLAVLQQPEAGREVESLFAARGKLARRPKAGASF